MSDWIPQAIDGLGYLGVALLMFLETVFPPIPSEVIMPLAGMQTVNGPLSLAGIVIAGSAGAMAGNVLWFAAARMLGLGRLKRLVDSHGRWLTLGWEDVETGQRAMRRTGHWFVCLGRLIPTLRSLVSIPAGLLRMPWPSFLAWSTFGTVGWTAMLAGAGRYLGQRFGAVETFVGPVSTGIAAVLICLYLWRVLTWSKRNRDV